jgi:predicted DNA-binding transcriptional regulator AlpA
MSDRDAYDINEFCARHGISRAFLYLLWKRNEGPRYMTLGSRRWIAAEAAAEWRRAREKAAQRIAA